MNDRPNFSAKGPEYPGLSSSSLVPVQGKWNRGNQHAEMQRVQRDIRRVSFMSYLQGFEPDVFISYSHIDDQPFGEDQERWVSEFHRNLETRIKILLGRGVAVWRDPKLYGTDLFSDEIRNRVAGSAVLVSVISPGYVYSEWCFKELQTFVDAAETRGGQHVGGRCRIVKVLKTPVPLQNQTGLLGALLGYEFFKIEPETDRVREFLLDPDPEARASYWTKLDDVAQDIARLFSSMTPGPKQDSDSTKVVYVAETTSDLKEKRDGLIRELVAHGYNPVPDRPLPLNSTELSGVIRDNLERSRVSVHLIGSRYGIVPEGESRSLIQVQNEIAADHCKGSVCRLIWIPKGLEAKEERQTRFLNDLRTNLRLLDRAELIEASFEEFKTNLFDRLRTAPRKDSYLEPDAPVQLYLVCDKQDRAEAVLIKACLFESGFEVLMPLAEGDAAEIREDHIENLRVADAVLIYWGRAGEPWFRAKMRDLLQMRAIRGTRSLPVQAVYLAAPASSEKLELQTKQAMIIRSFEPFNSSALSSFIAEVGKRAGVKA